MISKPIPNLLFVLLFFCTSASADTVPMRATHTTTMEYRTDNANGESDDDNYGAIIERLNLSASTGRLSTQMRIDGMYFLAPAADWNRDDGRLERISIRYRLDHVSLQAGDFYKQVGRGLALNLRKLDEVGLDITLRGGEIEYSRGPLTGGLFAGRTNSANIDNLKQRFLEDPLDTIAGGEGAWRFSPGFELGIHGVFRQNRIPVVESQSDDASMTVGGRLEANELWDALSIYIEGDLQETRQVDRIDEGMAIYGTIDLFLGDTSLILEGIKLENFSQLGTTNAYAEPFRYNQAPTLDRIDQETSAGVNEQGVRARIDQAFFDGEWTLFVNGMYKEILPGEDGEVTQMHGYGGLDGSYENGRSRLLVSGGVRDERASGQPGNYPVKDMIHGECDYLQWISGPWALHFASTTEYRGQLGLGGLDDVEDDTTSERQQDLERYIRGSYFAGLEVAGVGSLTFEYGNDHSDTRPEIRQNFFAGVLNWYATKTVQLVATAGTQRGGLKCLGGICRIYPSFAGAKIDVIGNHALGQ